MVFQLKTKHACLEVCISFKILLPSYWFLDRPTSISKLTCYLSDSPKLIVQDEHVCALQQLEQALNIAMNRAEQAETHWNQNRDRVAQLETEQIKLRSRTLDAEATIARAAVLENTWTRSREGADQLRALTTGSLGKLLWSFFALGS